MIATTADGGLHWTDVTPKPLGSYWKVFMIEAGRFDTLTAYAAVNTLRLDDQNPHFFRTHDGGKTWTEIVNGIPGGVGGERHPRGRRGRRDCSTPGPKREVYVSFDDGDHWESLRLNMAPSSVRDLQVKDDDLVAGDARPRLLDPRRHHAAAADRREDGGRRRPAFRPQASLRVRWNTNTDTPLPPDEPRHAESARGRASSTTT